jgi:glucosamine--fructose-6-phosphate aminotransferase (isomerizing)
MEAEVLSQPAVWKECLAAFSDNPVLNEISTHVSRDAEWLFIGCGSSYYVAQAAATFFVTLGLRARAVPPSELLLFPELTPDETSRDRVPVLISRSGRTSEVLQVAELLKKERGLRSIAITCSPQERLGSIASFTLRALGADEQSTVMTRSFTSMLMLLQYLGSAITKDDGLCEALLKLPDAFAPKMRTLHLEVQSFVSTRSFADYVFLAQGPLFAIANECSLKVTECSSSYSQVFHTLEFRHGPKSIVAPDVLTVFLLSESGYEAEVGMLEEVKSLGGTTVAIANRADERALKAADLLIELDLPIPETVRPVAFAPLGQLLGLFTGVKKGLNPDEPRHLSRVVILNSAV